ncbi:MAG TPA: hypothetical protein VKZ50_17190, partial [bacterium]|nr:hypothetical protein [bacterium]
ASGGLVRAGGRAGAFANPDSPWTYPDVVPPAPPPSRVRRRAYAADVRPPSGTAGAAKAPRRIGRWPVRRGWIAGARPRRRH